MTTLFDFVGSTTVAIVAIGVHMVSIALMLLILYQFVRIHRKRVDLLRELGDPDSLHLVIERKMLVVTYVVMTVLTIVAPFAVYR